MSDREEDFGFETESDNQSHVKQKEEELTVGLSDDGNEDFTISLADDESEEFSLESPEEQEPDFDLGPTGGEESFTMESMDEVSGFDQKNDQPATPDLFSMAEEEPVAIIDEGPVEEMAFVSETQESQPLEKKSSPVRLLGLVAALVVLGGAAFFFLGMPEDPPARVAAPVATKKQPITKPEQPVVKPIAKPVPAVAAVKKETPPTSAEKVPPVPAAVPPVEKPVDPVKVAAPAPATADTPVVTKPAAIKPTPIAPAAKFQVRAGAFLLSTNLKQAEEQVAKLGFEPRRSEAKKNMPMVRLKYGSYPRAEGAVKLAELKKSAPDAFILYSGDQSTVYAGSYMSLDKARRHADLLWEKKIRVEEVKVDVEVPLHRLSFGGFPDRVSAENAAQKARQAGLEAQVIAYKEP